MHTQTFNPAHIDFKELLEHASEDEPVFVEWKGTHYMIMPCGAPPILGGREWLEAQLRSGAEHALRAMGRQAKNLKRDPSVGREAKAFDVEFLVAPKFQSAAIAGTDPAGVQRLHKRFEWARNIQVGVQTKSEAKQQSRELGFMRGQFTVPDDFDRMYEDEIAEMFYGKDDS